MNVTIEIKFTDGLITTLDNIDYDILVAMYDKLESEKVVIWSFSNKDIIFNMRNVETIVVIKE